MMRTNYTPKVAKTCEVCGKITMYRPCEVRKYCSRRCMGEASRREHSVTWTCPECGDTVMKPRWQKGTFCSVMCADRAKVQDVAERFWSKVDRSGDCWLWTGQLGTDGYAKFWYKGRTVHASRVVYELTHGHPPFGHACHTCDNPACVRPDHLWDGTVLQNAHDMVGKGRSAKGERHFSYVHPETVARGERHGSRTHPESISRGNNHSQAKMTAEKVRLLRDAYEKGGVTFAALGRQFGITTTNARYIVLRKTWKHI